MRRTFLIHLIVVALATFTGSYSIAEDSNEELVKKDHKLIEGTWKVVALEVNGNKSSDEDVRKITVINGADGTWSIHSEGKEIIKGTSIIYPTQKPKTIDFTPTEGERKGEVHLGIYELDKNTRKLCFAPPGKARPTEFSSPLGSEVILINFERVKTN